jgi:hypothetical protein
MKPTLLAQYDDVIKNGRGYSVRRTFALTIFEDGGEQGKQQNNPGATDDRFKLFSHTSILVTQPPASTSDMLASRFRDRLVVRRSSAVKFSCDGVTSKTRAARPCRPSGECPLLGVKRCRLFSVSANGPKGTSTNKNTEPKATPNDLPEPSLVRAMLGSLQPMI